MLTVALVGADGAGKTTVGRRLEQELPVPARYLYMGVDADAGTHLLPTTRVARRVKRAAGVPPDVGGPRESRADRAAQAPLHGRARMQRSLREAVRLANRMSEEWYHQAIVWWHRGRGRVVIFDRHYRADFFLHDMAGGSDLPLGRRLHGAMLVHVYPQPDLVILLDAPPDVLHARKGEGTPATLARRRDEYLAYGRSIDDFAIVDAGRPLDQVVAEVADLVGRRLADHRGRRSPLGHTRPASDAP